MWSYSTVQRSRIAARPLTRKSGQWVEHNAAVGSAFRPFSSQGGNSRGGGRDVRGGNGNGRGAWSRNKKNRNKDNYSEQFLKPAARGELKNHRSGIPKLTGRKGKGRGVRSGEQLLEREEDQVMGYDNEGNMITEEDDFLTRGGRQQQQKNPKKTGTIEKGSKLEDLCTEDYEEVMEFFRFYQSLDSLEEEEKYYWNEIDFDGNEDEKKAALFEKLEKEATRDADGNLVVEVDDDTFAMFDAVDEASERSGDDKPKQQEQVRFNAPPDFIMDTLGVKAFDKPPNPKTYDVPTPLVLNGPTMSDFVLAMARHPTKYGQIRYVAPHPESTREPIPDLPPQRRNPPVDFVEGHKRFIYVWGLPPLLSVDEQPGDLDNPLHALELQKTTAALFDVSPEDVYPASISSAFIGFSNIRDHRLAVEIGPMQKEIESPLKLSKYVPTEGDKTSFDESEMDRVVILENLPSGLTPSALASTLFSSGTDDGDFVYGGLTADDFVMLSPHSAVLRLESAEQADNAIKSTIVEQRLKDFGKHRIRYSKARRELVYTGKHTGPASLDLQRELGHQLIVDGDMPTKDFYLSHAVAVHLRNLDPSMTKQEISKFFQPFCSMPRDIEGSIEFVTCHQGLPTGKAYVGFDEHEEAEAAIAACESNGRVQGLGHNKIIMKRVRDSRKIARDNRSSRTEEELLDSLDNWEQYVDPEDLEELLENGISKDALDEAFRAIRYQNPTFSSLDQAIRSEAINPEHETGGMYRELVQTYIATLKECLSTPDDPGPIYESLFLPDEELDTEIFEEEPARQEELRKRREVP